MKVHSSLSALLLLTTSSVSANGLVMTDVGGGLALDVPVGYVEKAQSSFELMRDSIMNCKESYAEYVDPIINRENSLVISKSRSGVCQVTWIKDSLWQYTCTAPSLGRKKWLRIFEARIEQERYFGDFSKQEQEILFDEKSCLVQRRK